MDEIATQSNDNAFELFQPEYLSSPVVFASPHSGSFYSDRFLEQTHLDRLAIRRSEDAFVHDLFRTATVFGAPLLAATFPRAYVDANREPYELDPEMFEDALPDWVNTTSTRVNAGLGTVAKIVAGGAQIYREKLRFQDVQERVQTSYEPYHAALRSLVDRALEQFGCCLLIDCHSMPSMASAINSSQTPADIVLGDCHGSSCNNEITGIAERTLRDLGLTVRRNKPYAGGFTTRHYSRRQAGVHTLQIEINRSLYMNEQSMEPNAGYDRLQARLEVLIARMAGIEHGLISPRLAAE